LVGPSVTFWSTLICGKRLKLWKTIPTSRRSAFTSTPRPDTSLPHGPDVVFVDGVSDDGAVVGVVEELAGLLLLLLLHARAGRDRDSDADCCEPTHTDTSFRGAA